MSCQACKKSLKAQYQSGEFAFDAATFFFLCLFFCIILSFFSSIFFLDT